jgi:mono/diheme cytochrome c family protein
METMMKISNLFIAMASATLIGVALPVHAEPPIYQVSGGNQLDADTYKGFKLYRNWCARCHGTYGQGMVGPNLADSLKVLSKDEFFAVVENGKSGSIGSMPAWKSNPKVMKGRDNLYSYLKARSDGAIGEVKPKKIK